MKILYVNENNASYFDNENKKHLTFAKYFSPHCPACIAMEDEWNDMCTEINKKYNTDLIFAQIDPNGMNKLQEKNTFTDVDYVPFIVLLEKGKKIKMYDGERNKDKMIQFLLENNYISPKFKGGNKIFKDKIEDFKFVENEYWLKPFLISYKKYHSNNLSLSNVVNYAIICINNIFRNTTMSMSSQSYTINNEWYNCIANNEEFKKNYCRISKGFDNKWVPRSKKLNPDAIKNKDRVKLANEGYNFIENYSSINQILTTPMSDYTRFSTDSNNEERFFIQKLRQNLKTSDNEIDAILKTYNVEPTMSYSDMKRTLSDVQKTMNKNIKTAKNKIKNFNKTKKKSNEKSSKKSKTISIVGGKNKTKKKNCCIGKRDGKTGCRSCCKSRRNYKRCITRCMRGY